jgi:UDP-glucose 4-epimerase
LEIFSISLSRVLITGASGFIGSHLTKQLLDSGCEVAVLQREAKLGHRLSELQNQITVIRNDAKDCKELIRLLCEFKPTTLFHLGWAGVNNSFRNDINLQVDNLRLSLNLIDAGHAVGIKHWIGAGSQAEYGPKNHAISEIDSTHPTTLYGASKLAAYHLSKVRCSLLGIKHSWIRIFSTYGPGDNDNWMIPSLIKQLLNGQQPELTAGEQLWDYLHVADAARAFVAVGTAEAEGVFNLGSGEAPSLRSTIERIKNLIDPHASLGFGIVPYRPDQVMILQAKIEKLVNLTNWKPRISLEDGLSETVVWYRNNLRL